MLQSLSRRASALALVTMVGVAGCTATPAKPSGGGDAVSPEPRPLVLDIRPEHKAKAVAPRDAVTVRAANGTLSSVRLVNAAGKVVQGRLGGDRSSWSLAEPLGYGKRYTLTVRGAGDDGREVRKRSTFTTLRPDALVSVSTNVPDGGTVGVGMPISFTFSAPITDKKAAERALRVTTSNDTQGGFHWFDDTWVVWRPRTYWRPGTRVKVDADIYGRHLGGGQYGAQDVNARMKIGRKLVAVADGKSHQLVIYVNDRRVKTMPTAMGKPGDETPRGTYTVMSEHYGYTFDSSTYGVPVESPDGYRTKVTHATRLSYSGIFYHSAPWSVWAQGNTNVSHGCINLSTENADWLMKQSRVGDLFRVRNSGGPRLEPTDGLSVWQLSWQQWRTGGAR